MPQRAKHSADTATPFGLNSYFGGHFYLRYHVASFQQS